MIKELRADPALTAKVSSEIERLGFYSSDSEDEDDTSIKKKARGKKLQSGKTAKLTSRVLAPQHWPHSFLSLAYISKEWPYDELTLAEFAAGYASILQLNSLPPHERSGSLDHLVVLMYLVTQFPWLVVREFHAAVLFEIECSRSRWGDSFAHLESRLLRSTTKSSISSSRPSSAVFFCPDFQTGKCSHTKDHYGTIRNERKWLQHICTRCWTSSRTIARHSEFSANCPGSSPSLSSSFDPSATTSTWLSSDKDSVFSIDVISPASHDSRLRKIFSPVAGAGSCSYAASSTMDSHGFPDMPDISISPDSRLSKDISRPFPTFSPMVAYFSSCIDSCPFQPFLDLHDTSLVVCFKWFDIIRSTYFEHWTFLAAVDEHHIWWMYICNEALPCGGEGSHVARLNFKTACCLLSALPLLLLLQFGRGRLPLVVISFYVLSLLFGPFCLSEFTFVGPL